MISLFWNLTKSAPVCFAEIIIFFAKEIKLDIPLVVRLAGTKVIEGQKILADSNLKILAANDLNDAAKKIVKAVK